jgi:hypothetical protein
VRLAAAILVLLLGGAAAFLLVGAGLLAQAGDLNGSYPGHELVTAWAQAGRSATWIRVVVDGSVALLVLGGVAWYLVDGSGVFRRREAEDSDSD